MNIIMSAASHFSCPHHALLFLIFLFSLASNIQADDDAMWLLSFKASIYDPFDRLRTWNPSTHPCTDASSSSSSWFGVTCDPLSLRVVSLNFTAIPGNGITLVGTLPPSLGNLTHLRTLSIPHLAFSGYIPPQLGNLKSLQVLQLQACNFSGPLPDSLTNLSSLRLLNLSYNSFSGPIPDGLIGRELTVVDLSNNQLSGDLTVASAGCQFLTHLKLSNNFLVYGIPADIGRCSNLRTLLLDGNTFEGKIPPELGQLSHLRVLDVSRNSLTDIIPPELANCRRLSVLVLTNLLAATSSSSYQDGSSDFSSFRGEFNAFDGGVPSGVLLLPNLQMLWAPRANLGGRLPDNWTNSCSLRVVNLGLNNITGSVPLSLGMCTNLTFLDLSSNGLQGHLPGQLRFSCMMYVNVSRNFFSGVISNFQNSSCSSSSPPPHYVGGDLVDLLVLDREDDLQIPYFFSSSVWDYKVGAPPGFSTLSSDISIAAHDFSWNGFAGPLPLFSVGDNSLLVPPPKASYWLFLNNNNFNASLTSELVSSCNNLQSIYVNLSSNLIYGTIDAKFFNCSSLVYFGAAQNQINGSIAAAIASLQILQYLDLSRNKLSSSLPHSMRELKSIQYILLGENNLTGEIPAQLGDLNSLLALNLSHNALTGHIPASLANATNLQILLLDHNAISGDIPSSLTNLSTLVQLDLSFNNLSGHVPHFQQPIDCNGFRGNRFLLSCPDPFLKPPVPSDVGKSHKRSKSRSFIIAISISMSFLFTVLVGTVCLLFGRRKFGRFGSLRRKVVVVFADAPAGLNYDNVVRATGNFSIQNLIGTGGFGSTYKAELAPGFLVAVKRLSIGRLQGIQQFDAEIRTLGRVRHKNLVTLIGYHVGEAEMFLVYNYLPGGNLETFIHGRSGMNKKWPVIHKIAVDVAQALTFLHYSCVPRIVHRDIKPSNILLDEELNAYLSDFGLARLLEVFETHATTDVAGTFGYVAPEYATTCRVSDKADVYSFGVVLLELMSRKKSLDPSFSEYGDGFNIVAWSRLLIAEGRSSELFPTDLLGSSPKDDLLAMVTLALSCTAESLSVRPTMKQVLEKLKHLCS